MAHDIAIGEVEEADAFDAIENRARFAQARLLASRQIDLGDVAGDDALRSESEAREEHLHLLGVVFWASSRMMNESLSVRPRMNASGAISITLRSIIFSTFSNPMT